MDIEEFQKMKKAFIRAQNDEDADDWYSSSRDRAEDVMDRFERYALIYLHRPEAEIKAFDKRIIDRERRRDRKARKIREATKQWQLEEAARQTVR